MATAPTALRRADLSGHAPVVRLSGRNVTKADILVYDLGEQRVAVKDYGQRPWWVRQTVGRWFVRRECTAYRAAAGAAGLPRFLGRLDAFALATEWLDARPLATFDRARIPHGVVGVLTRIVAGLHERGVALGDLHHRDILLGDDDRVHVVDLATAWIAPPGSGPLRRAIFRRFSDNDRIALARLDALIAGSDPEYAVAQIGGSAARWHRFGRRLKRAIDRLRGRRHGPDHGEPRRGPD